MSDEERGPARPDAPLDLEGLPQRLAEDRARVARAVASAAAHVAAEEHFASVLAEIVGQSEALGARAAQLFLAEGNALRLVAWREVPAALVHQMGHVPFDAPLFAAKAARTGRIQVGTEADLGDEHAIARRLLATTGARSIVAAPLVLEGRVAGVVSWLRSAPDRPSTAELAATESLVQVYAVALENARLRERDQRRKALQEAVRLAVLRIGGTLDLQAVLQIVVDEGRAIVGARYAALGITQGDDAAMPFSPWAFSGVAPAVRDAIGRDPRPVGLLGAVPREGRPIRLLDLHVDPRFRGFPPGHPEMRSFLGVPIRFQGQSVGNLYFGEKIGGAAFTDIDEEAAVLLATHAGVAMENARIHGQLLEEVERRKVAEAEQERLLGALESEHRWLREVVERSPVGILLFDAYSGTMKANRRAEAITGMKIDPARGREQLVGCLETVDGRKLLLEELPCSIALGGVIVQPAEYRFRSPGGRLVPLRIGATPILGPRGTILGAAEVLDDISDAKELERIREEWNSVVAHDLRQPLTTISAFAAVIAKAPDRPAEVRKHAEHIRTATRRLDRMIGDLLEVSRLETRRLTLDLAPTDLEALVRDAVARAAPEMRDHPVELGLEKGLPPLPVDAARIEQVLFNLLTNAAKYGYPGTPITVQLHRLAQAIEIAVSNEGGGIAAAQMPRIFDRFHRTPAAQQGAQPGLGLGLYVSRGLVEAHGGQLVAESEPGKVTTFRIRLPLRR